MSEFNGFSKEVTAKGYKVDGKHYKRVPRGYDDAHPNAALEYWSIDFFSITPTRQYSKVDRVKNIGFLF